MKTGTITSQDFLRGHPERQEYYRRGRRIREVMRSEIDSICDCGYLTLKPRNAFEEHNGGLTVRRYRVRIVDDRTGEIVRRLRPRREPDRDSDIMTSFSCNACANDWR